MFTTPSSIAHLSTETTEIVKVDPITSSENSFQVSVIGKDLFLITKNISL